MKLSIGIVGLPNVGKSSLFKALTKNDIAGLVKGASQGQGLGNQFLTHIRETNAIAHVVRCFKNDSIIHVDNSVQPIRDVDTIETELVLKDMETVEKRLTKAESDSRNGDKNQIALRDTLKEIKQELDTGTPLFANPGLANVLKNVSISNELGLLTAKPQLFVLNGTEEDVTEE